MSMYCPQSVTVKGVNRGLMKALVAKWWVEAEGGVKRMGGG
jgi:hypothetical protein